MRLINYLKWDLIVIDNLGAREIKNLSIKTGGVDLNSLHVFPPNKQVKSLTSKLESINNLKSGKNFKLADVDYPEKSREIKKIKVSIA